MSKQTKGGLRERQRAARRNAILDAARQLTLEVGYEAMTMDSVAERAMVTKPTLYAYFPNKRELAVASLVRTIHEANEDSIRGENGLAPLEKLRFRIRRGFEVKLATEEIVYSMPNEEIRSHPDFVEAEEKVIRHFEELVKQGQLSEQLNPSLNPTLCSHIFFGLMGNNSFKSLILMNKEKSTKIIETISVQLFRGLLQQDIIIQ